jgi:hypothetical protein
LPRDHGMDLLGVRGVPCVGCSPWVLGSGLSVMKWSSIHSVTQYSAFHIYSIHIHTFCALFGMSKNIHQRYFHCILY